MKKIKISELPQSNSIQGLFTIGTDSQNRSVKVPLGEVINEEISKVKRTYGYSRIDALTVGSSADDVATALIAENENKRTMPNVGDVLVDWGGVTRVPVVRQTVQTGGEKPIYSFSFRTADNTATKTVKIQGYLYEPQTVVSVETVKDVTQQQISTLDTQLAEEATARLNQDDVLEAKITEEKNARTEADTAINAEIATVKDSVVGKKSKTWNGFAEVFNNIDENKATADCAHAEGHQTTASEQAAHAEGKKTVASSPYAHAEGDQTQATSSSSHSEGYGTRASGYASHAEGGSTVASGNFTHAGGEHTKATNYAEQAIGYYNKSTYVENKGQWKGDSESTLFSVGNGTSESDRKNALEVKQDGTVLVQKPGTKQTVKVYDGLMTAEERDKFFDLVADIEGLEDVDETSSWLIYKRCDSSADFATINTATAEKHGLMSKSDKATLDALPTRLTTEQTARVQADKTLQTNIDALKATATADANGLMSKEDKVKLDTKVATKEDIAKERTAREEADKVLTANLAKEVTDRTNAVNAEATAREQADTAINGEIQGIKDKGSLHDLFLASGATYNQDTKMYQLNGLDLTFNEMLTTYKYTAYFGQMTSWHALFTGTKIRTNCQINSPSPGWSIFPSAIECFARCPLLENVNLLTSSKTPSFIRNATSMFDGAPKLKKVIGINLQSSTDNKKMFQNCKSLETVQIDGLNKNLEFKQSPKLTKESLVYLINHASPSSPITITLHPTAYAMATADPEIQAELEKQPNISLAEGEPTA